MHVFVNLQDMSMMSKVYRIKIWVLPQQTVQLPIFQVIFLQVVYSSADIFTRLKIRKDQVPIKPLIQGKLEEMHRLCKFISNV